ncbi:glucose-1-phosphate thymidylyltransferase [Paenibacillus sp. JCM 10914]|nr:glucose-1-phosphate thymidylyltransferase [Paenibacillus sp. JCM 10914]
MIFHPVYKLRQAGLTDFLIVTGKDHMGDVVNLLGSGSEMGVSFTYKVQDEAGGIAQALNLAHQFAGDEPIAVILGDNVFEDDISTYVANFQSQRFGAKILIKEVADPNRFGVPEIQGSQIISIEEKPEQPKSNYAVTGIYMYDQTVFDIIKTLNPSARGELEITDVNNAYINQGKLTFDVLQGWWTDAGTHASLARANELARDVRFGDDFGKLKL